MATHKSIAKPDPKVRTTVCLPKSLDRAVEVAALDMGTKSAVIEAALREFLKLDVKGAA